MRLLLNTLPIIIASVEVPIQYGPHGTYRITSTFVNGDNDAVNVQGVLGFGRGLAAYLPIETHGTLLEEEFFATPPHFVLFGDYPPVPARVLRSAMDGTTYFGVGLNGTLLNHFGSISILHRPDGPILAINSPKESFLAECSVPHIDILNGQNVAVRVAGGSGSDHLDYIELEDKGLRDRLMDVPPRVLREIQEQLLNAGTIWIPWRHGQDIYKNCSQAIVDGMPVIELNFVGSGAIMLPPTEYITYDQDRQTCYVRFGEKMSGDYDSGVGLLNPLMFRRNVRISRDGEVSLC